MKLLYITNQICGSGGLERVLAVKASYLAEKLGYDVHIITFNQGNHSLFYNFSNKLHYHDIKTHKFNPLSHINGLKRKVTEIKPDIISVCDDGVKGFFIPQILKTTCPMIYERHASKNIFKTKENPDYIRKIKFSILNMLMNYGASKYDSFVVLTNDNLKEWKLNNLKVIANPLSFYPKEKSSLENKRVIAVGSHTYQKGFDRLLKIWSKVILAYPDWILDIYGKIDSNKTYIKLADNLKLSNSVNFHQPVNDIETKYRAASIYLMSSRSEGFGMVLIEAMSNGVPCISFDCPRGPKDIITDGEDGFLVPDGNIDAFVERLELLIKDKDLRVDMGRKAILNAQKYLPEYIVPQWDNLFKSLLKI